MFISVDEIAQTIKMIQNEHLDIRTVTMGISLLDCARGNIDDTCDAVYEKICRYAKMHLCTLLHNYHIKFSLNCQEYK